VPPTVSGPMAALRGIGDEGATHRHLDEGGELVVVPACEHEARMHELVEVPAAQQRTHAGVCRPCCAVLAGGTVRKHTELAPPLARVPPSTHARAQGTGTSRWPQKRASGDSHSRIGKAGGSAARATTPTPTAGPESPH